MALVKEDGYLAEDVMLDLETLATTPNAVIISVGAVYFSKEKLGGTFYAVLDPEDQQANGRVISPDTMAWWAKQSPEARKVFDEEPTPTAKALADFADFLGNRNVKVWGNGADFDCVLLGSLYEAFGMRKPWSFTNNRCFRTLKNISQPRTNLPPRRSTHHNALDDAIYQAEHAQIYLKGTFR